VGVSWEYSWKWEWEGGVEAYRKGWEWQLRGYIDKYVERKVSHKKQPCYSAVGLQVIAVVSF